MSLSSATALAALAVAAASLLDPVTAGAEKDVAPEVGRSYYAYVCAESDDEVALIAYGPSGGRVVETIAVGSFPAETEGPHGITVSPDGNSFAFVSRDEDEVVVFSTSAPLAAN